MKTRLLSFPTVIGCFLTGQLIASPFVINQGAFNETTGAFTRNTTVPVDTRQGIVQSFTTVSLNNPGDFVQATFSWVGGGGNNAATQVFFGFFDGPAVTANAQTSSTDDWTGVFQSFGLRNSDGTTNSAVGWQGIGDQPIYNYPSNLSSANVDGAWTTITSGHRPALLQNISGGNSITMQLERIDADFIRLTTTYTTARSDGSSSGSGNGISWVQTASGGIATLTSTYSVNDIPISFSGIALAGSANFTMTDLQITAIPEPSTYAAIFGLIALGGVLLRRRLRQ